MFKKKGDEAVLGKLGDAPAPFNDIGQHLHRIITESGPELEPVVRWGLAFYVKDGEDVCYIKPDKNFIVFGVAEALNPARQDDATMHPVAWTVTSVDAATEERISSLVRGAVGHSNQ